VLLQRRHDERDGCVRLRRSSRNATSCATPMTHAASHTTRAVVLGSYQMVFSRAAILRVHPDPHAQDVTGRRRERTAQLFREDGVMRSIWRAARQRQARFGSFIGSRCSGVGATLACTDYVTRPVPQRRRRRHYRLHQRVTPFDAD
jgi:hypothetical protein